MKNKARSIAIFLLDGEPDGVRTAEIPMSTIIALAFRSNQMARVRKEFEGLIDRAGVYLRVGVDDDNRQRAYIGESENVLKRLQRWGVGKDEETDDKFSEVLVFVSKDQTMTGSHARYAEAELIKAAKDNPHWVVPNKQHPASTGKLPKPDEFFMAEFVDQAKTLAGALGCNVFKTLPQKQATTEAPSSSGAEAVYSPTFQMSGSEYSATAAVLMTTGEIVVRAGSFIKSQAAPSTPKGALKLRDSLLADGVLVNKEQKIAFSMDYPFPSASAAAAVVAGMSINGPLSWRLVDDPAISYGDWKEAEEAKAAAPADGGADVEADPI